MFYIIFVILLVSAAIVVAIMYFRDEKIDADAAKPAHEKHLLPMHDWSDTLLDRKQFVCDPIADAVAKRLFEEHTIDEVNELMGHMSRNHDIEKNLPSFLIKYFEDTAVMPAWANKALLKEGEQFYMDHGVKISALLFLKSLPECYSIGKGAEVLHRTGRLNVVRGKYESLSRRIAESAQFTVNVMAPGALTHLGTGIRTAQKVRLIHAMIRIMIHKAGWDVAKFGEPINQEDMAFTLTTFSSSVIDGLEVSGVGVSEAEKEAYMHCWRLVGHIMGIDDELLFNNYKDARALHRKVLHKKIEKTEAGKELTEALVTFLEKVSPSGKLDKLVPDLIRHYAGNAVADSLQLPPERQISDKELHLDIVSVIQKEEALVELPVVKQIAAVIDRVIITGASFLLNHRSKVVFQIPDSLRDKWNLPHNKPENL